MNDYVKKAISRVLGVLGVALVRKHEVPHDIDEEIKHIITRVRPYTMTSSERLNALCQAVRYVSLCKIDGDIVECGVWRGGSSLAAALVLHAVGDTSRIIWMYDTYEGMSDPTEHDRDVSGRLAHDLLQSENKGQDSYIWCLSSLEDVKKNVQMSEYPFSLFRFIQGKVEDTLKTNIPEKIALLRLDTDWYESTRIEMEILFPKLVKGGVLVIDDYGHWQGARKAIDEYLESHNIRILLNRIDYTGRIAVKVD